MVGIYQRLSRYELDLLAFLAGLFSLLVQVIATHFTFLTQAQSSYAVGLSLFSFLTGLAVAARCAMGAQKFLLQHFSTVIGLAFALVGFYFSFVTHNESRWRVWFEDFAVSFSVSPEAGHAITVLILSVIYLFVPALALGLIFPLINDRRGSEDRVLTGRASSLDYLGAGVGCLCASFYLIPMLGLERSAFIVSLTLLAASLLWLDVGRKVVVAVGVVTLLLGNLRYMRPDNETLFSKPSPFGTVDVTTHFGDRVLAINGRGMCSSNRNRSERWLGKIALDTHGGRSLRALNIGLGCGYTADEIRRHPRTGELTVVEINPVVVEANRYFVEPGPSVEIKNEDGFSFLKTSDEQFDVVAVDVEEPSIMHSTSLYTLDFFRLVKSRMSSDGVFSLWSFHQEETAKIILNTLRKAFKNAEVTASNKHLVYVASDAPLNLPKAERNKNRVKEIEAVPLTDVATLQSNPYLKYFKVNQIFGFDREHNDIYELKR